MKPSIFEYSAPRDLNEVVSILNDNSEARVLAGGQSLVPSMNFRLASPSHLIDLKNINSLSELIVEDGIIKVGALVRHSTLEHDQRIKEINPLINEAIKYVAHIPIRNRGTTVGSICHADAAAEMPLVLLMTDGYVLAQGPNGERKIKAEDFFEFHMTTSLNQNEVVTEAVFGKLPENSGYSFKEFARRHGDYAIAAVSVILNLNNDNSIKFIRIGACGVASKPILMKECENLLKGSNVNEELITKVLDASKEYVTAEDDHHATNAYRKHLLSNLLRQALNEAIEKVS